MNNVNKTLYIPLYGKACVSSRGLLLEDKKAEEIWAAEGFPLGRKSKSKWLAYRMGMRSAVFDRWLTETMEQLPDAAVIHAGCGLDSRITRVGSRSHRWYDVDFPDVIAERKRYFAETEDYRMISSDIRDKAWISRVNPQGGAIIVMEGISMYLHPEELREVLKQWKEYFGEIRILMDSYTVFAAKATRYNNPINEVGVTHVYGFDDPRELTVGTGLTFCGSHPMTPQWLTEQLPPREQTLFKTVFAGKTAQKIHRLYEYR